MTAQPAIAQSQLYDRDLALWYAEVVAQLKAGDLASVDLAHLIEEIEGLAARDGEAPAFQANAVNSRPA